MIVIRYDESDRAVPLVECDVCQDPIRDAALGVAVLGPDGEPPRYAHKEGCHDKAEAMLEARGSARGWQELTTHLLYLLQNVGLKTPERIADAMRIDGGDTR